MTKKILIIIMILITTIVKSQELTIVKTFYDLQKTKLKESYSVLKNTPTLHGIYKKWDTYGILEEEKNYNKGELKLSKIYFAEMVGSILGLNKGCLGKLYLKTIYENEDNYIEEEYKCQKGGINNINEKRYYENKQRVRYILYFDNGKLLQDAPRNGKYIAYYENGNKKKEFTAVNGKAEGLFRFWHENGILDIEANTKNGEKIGEWTEYYENGEIRLKMNRINDTLVIGEEYDSVKNIKRFERNYHYSISNYNGEEILLQNGIEKEFYDNGKIKKITTFKAELNEYNTFRNEKKSGQYIEYYSNGQVNIEGSYKNNYKIGLWKQYDENGNLLNEIDND